MGKTTLTVTESTRDRFNAEKAKLDEQQDAPDHTADSFVNALLDTWVRVGPVPEDPEDAITDALTDDEVAIIGSEEAMVNELVGRIEAATDGEVDAEALATIEERTGRIEKMLEDMGAGR